ncbi:hypothetical protein EXY23_15065 [Roseicella aquatilis]|uniref:Uncharacterized protein n=2 Tax=Roseicella aquatilis TaxID=2527868 RepID=A0A4R4DG25_9PROT|nr:hypothetical protein EXY23_15065 [Roseicella aquatilis]
MALLLGLGIAGCQADPNAPYLWGIGDPVRGAAFYAQRNFGDTSRWKGQPDRAAVAVEQLEFLTSEFATNPIYAPAVNPAVLQTLQAARAEMRGFLGIPDNADPQVVIEAMRRAGAALRAGNRAGAEAALSGPAFPAGPQVMLERMSNMPFLPRCANAAGMAAAEIARLDRMRV